MAFERTRRIIQLLPCQLTEPERDQKGRSLGLERSRLKATQLEKKKVVTGFKEREEEHSRIIEELTEASNTGIEHRDVECEITFNPARRQAVITRTDTHEQVDTRPMTKSEIADYEDSMQTAFDARGNVG